MNATEWVVPLTPTVVTLAFLFYLLANPEKAEKWGSMIARVFAGVSHRAELRAVAGDIQGEINKASKSIENCAKGSVPYGVRIRWVKTATREAFLQGNEVVVVMSRHTNQARNLVNSVLAYLSVGLLPQTRIYLEGALMRAIELAATRTMISERADAMDLFQTEVLPLELGKDEVIGGLVTMLFSLDDEGYFARIYLNELQELGRRLYPRSPTQDVLDEIDHLTCMMDALMKREPGEKIQTSVTGRDISTGMMLIGTEEKIAISGLDPYVNYVMWEMHRGIRRIYVMAAGMNVPLAGLVCNRIVSTGVASLVSEQKYKSTGLSGRPVKIIVSLLESKTDREQAPNSAF